MLKMLASFLPFSSLPRVLRRWLHSDSPKGTKEIFSQASHLTFLNLNFLIYKMEIIVLPILESCCGI